MLLAVSQLAVPHIKMSQQPTLQEFIKAVEQASVSQASTSRNSKRPNLEMSFSPPALSHDEKSGPSLSDTLQSALKIPIPEGTDPFLGEMIKTVVAAQGHIAKTNELCLGETGACRARMEEQDKKINEMDHHLSSLDSIVKTMYGRMIRLEKELKIEKESKTDLVARSMSNNLIFNTTGKEYKEKAEEDTDHVIRLYLSKALKMAPAAIKGINITHSHRMGQASEKFNKQLIAKIPSHQQRMLILSNTKALKGTKDSVNIQTPNEYNERKQYSWPAFKKAKNAKKPASYKGHVLYVEKKPVLKYLPVPIPPCGSDILGIERESLNSGTSSVIELNGHSVQARVVRGNTTQDVRDALDEVLRDGFSAANFISYAFRLTDREMQGGYLEDFESGGNAYAGLHILRHLRDKEYSDVIAFVAQTTIPDSPPMKAKTRNKLFENAVSEAVEILNTGSDTDASEAEEEGGG